MVRALDLRLEIAGSIPAAALSSATIGKFSDNDSTTFLFSRSYQDTII